MTPHVEGAAPASIALSGDCRLVVQVVEAFFENDSSKVAPSLHARVAVLDENRRVIGPEKTNRLGVGGIIVCGDRCRVPVAAGHGTAIAASIASLGFTAAIIVLKPPG